VGQAADVDPVVAPLQPLDVVLDEPPGGAAEDLHLAAGRVAHPRGEALLAHAVALAAAAGLALKVAVVIVGAGE